MIAEIIPEIKTTSEKYYFDYLVPDRLVSQAKIGSLVYIPFGQKICRGIIKKFKARSDVPPKSTKEVLQLTDLVLPTEYTIIAQWVANYYLCSLGEAISLFLPPDLKNPRNQKQAEKTNKEFVKKLNRLNTEQDRIFEAISQTLSAKNKRPALIYGVTGSGKTEVYLHLAKRTIQMGKSVILLVPEIILTPQNIERFEEVFAGEVCIMHSGLSKSERWHCYQDFYNGKKKIIIGPRSALLVPNENIGLIIIDEEQEESYKQEQNPRYDALTLAEKISSRIGAQLVVGSATPRIETYYKAKSSEYDLFKISGRYNQLTLPTAEIVDLRAEIKRDNYSPISEKLQSALFETLKKREQAILFLNRRGMATFVSCRECGYVAYCSNCDVPLIQHLSSRNGLICHHCGKKYPSVAACPECKSLKIRYFGSGVEKIENEISRLFPKAKIKRVDSGVLRNHRDYEQFYHNFRDHKFDIVVGTQILAKGLDIPDTTLVGIISADTGLHLPYFRASERIFRLITQVSGRSGRREKTGRTVIQSYWPNSAAIRFAAKHDFEGFYQSEIKKRLERNYPPATHIIRVLSEHLNENTAKERIELLAKELKKTKCDFIGPGPCFFSRLSNKFRYQIIIKIKKLPDVNISALFTNFSRLVWDVDAQNLL